MLSVGSALPPAGCLGYGGSHTASPLTQHAWSPMQSPMLAATTIAPGAPAAVVAGIVGSYRPQVTASFGEPMAAPQSGAPYSCSSSASPAMLMQAQTAGASAFKAGGCCPSTMAGANIPIAPAGYRVSAIAAAPPFGLAEENPLAADMMLAQSDQDMQVERRPQDPFFYPTTVRPLTSHGFMSIAGTTPPRLMHSDGFGDSEGIGCDDKRLHFVPAPLHTFVDSPEENQRLQDQNDTLARHVQALEHAKSMAAVQAAQQMRQIHARQDYIKKQAQLERQKAREMQADFRHSVGQPFPEQADSGGDTIAQSQTPERELFRQPFPEFTPTAAELSLPPTARGSNPPAQEMPTPPPPMRPDGANVTKIGTNGGAATALHEAAAAAFRADPLRQLDGLMAAGSKGHIPDAADIPTVQNTMQTLPQQPMPAADNFRGDLPDQPQWNQDAWAPPKREEGGLRGNAPPPPVVSLGGGGHRGGAAELPADPVPLPTQGVSSNDTATMANRILNAHYSTSSFKTVEKQQIPSPPSATSGAYVDAMGNPLAMPIALDLPNIKDDWPVEVASVAERRGAPSVSSTAERRTMATANVGLKDPWSGTASVSDPLEVARASALHVGSAVGENATPKSAQDEMALSASLVEQPVLTPQERVGLGSARSGAHSASGAASSAVASVAGTAVAKPPPLQPVRSAASSQAGGNEERAKLGRRDQSLDRRSTASTSARRERSAVRDDAPTAQDKRAVSQPPMDQSEELQAELEECLDTISWCADSVTRESIQDVKNTIKPVPIIKDVIETVAMLIGQPETKWDKLKGVISAPAFPEKVKKLNPTKSISKDQFKKLRDRLEHPEFDEELIKTVCVPVVPLAMWCRAIGVYLSKTKFRGGPEIRPVAGAGAASPPPPPQSSGPRLQPPGAHMLFDPDINTMSIEELRRVQDLTISRPNVGEIVFHGETDCTDLDFERIVRLEIGEVLVYPDMASKPPIGVGLNKPATVTMYQCWPPNTSKLLQDPKSQERYKKKIKQMTEEKHAKFIDYSCASGVWKFSVDNF